MNSIFVMFKKRKKQLKIFHLNFGPQHPSPHGVLRLILRWILGFVLTKAIALFGLYKDKLEPAFWMAKQEAWISFKGKIKALKTVLNFNFADKNQQLILVVIISILVWSLASQEAIAFCCENCLFQGSGQVKKYLAGPECDGCGNHGHFLLSPQLKSYDIGRPVCGGCGNHGHFPLLYPNPEYIRPSLEFVNCNIIDPPRIVNATFSAFRMFVTLTFFDGSRIFKKTYWYIWLGKKIYKGPGGSGEEGGV